MSRGRPNEQVEKLDKWVLNSKDVTYYYDKNKSENGCWKVINNDTTRYSKPKIDQRTYGGHPVVMVFKTSNRSNAQTKIKVFNKNIDYVISAKKLPGVPEKAEIIELAVGESFISKFKEKYNLI
jgi:hypothetical protein